LAGLRAFTVTAYSLVILLVKTLTECDPAGTEENMNGVTSPVSLPSMVIPAAGGSLVTRKNPF
jgi:hypothetical protein